MAFGVVRLKFKEKLLEARQARLATTSRSGPLGSYERDQGVGPTFRYDTRY